MPVGRYLLVAGGGLLSLLLLADWYLPKPAAGLMRAETERPVIRIHSDRKGPVAIAIN